MEKFNEIKLDDISFKYKNTENYVFQEFNLTINKFDKIGVTGHSGSGKSTLVEILMGLLKTDREKVLFNNRVMQEITTEWYKLFAYVPQKVVLIDDTLIANITLEYSEDNIDYQKLNDSIKYSGLKNL